MCSWPSLYPDSHPEIQGPQKKNSILICGWESTDVKANSRLCSTILHLRDLHSHTFWDMGDPGMDPTATRHYCRKALEE